MLLDIENLASFHFSPGASSNSFLVAKPAVYANLSPSLSTILLKALLVVMTVSRPRTSSAPVSRRWARTRSRMLLPRLSTSVS